MLREESWRKFPVLSSNTTVRRQSSAVGLASVLIALVIFLSGETWGHNNLCHLTQFVLCLWAKLCSVVPAHQSDRGLCWALVITQECWLLQVELPLEITHTQPHCLLPHPPISIITLSHTWDNDLCHLTSDPWPLWSLLPRSSLTHWSVWCCTKNLNTEIPETNQPTQESWPLPLSPSSLSPPCNAHTLAWIQLLKHMVSLISICGVESGQLLGWHVLLNIHSLILFSIHLKGEDVKGGETELVTK